MKACLYVFLLRISQPECFWFICNSRKLMYKVLRDMQTTGKPDSNHLLQIRQAVTPKGPKDLQRPKRSGGEDVGAKSLDLYKGAAQETHPQVNMLAHRCP